MIEHQVRLARFSLSAPSNKFIYCLPFCSGLDEFSLPQTTSQLLRGGNEKRHIYEEQYPDGEVEVYEYFFRVCKEFWSLDVNVLDVISKLTKQAQCRYFKPVDCAITKVRNEWRHVFMVEDVIHFNHKWFSATKFMLR